MVIFVPLGSISLGDSVPPLWHDRSHNGLWHQPSNDHSVIQLWALTSHNGPLFASESLPFFVADPSDKAVLQKHQLSLNNRSQRRLWLCVSRPLANCTTVWAVWCEGKPYNMQPCQKQVYNLTLWQRYWPVSYYFVVLFFSREEP